MSAIIKLTNVEQWYNKGKENEVHSLKSVTLEIEEGDYVAFFGPSGCGKTTLLYATSGIDRVFSGSIEIKGQHIEELSNQELAIFRQTGIGIIFQQFNLVPSLTVVENVALPMAFVGITKAKAEEEAWKLVKYLDLEKYATHYPTELSGGQQQRVGIARALANNPPIIIADEPLGNLDSTNAKNVLKILKKLNEEEKRTIIMVTHEAWSLQDVRTVFHMQDGTITSVEHRTPSGVEEQKLSATDKIKKDLENEVASKEAISMMVRIISNFFMRGSTVEEARRFETILKKRFENALDTVAFGKELTNTFATGGAGLWKRKAERVVSYVERLIEKQQDLHLTLEELEKNPETPMKDEVRDLRQWLAQEYVGEISSYRAEVLEELIDNRIRGFITADKFLNLLYKPLKQSGGGFPLHTAQKMAERLEVVLAGTHINHV